MEIDAELVEAVLLSDGKWHQVVRGTFDVGDVWPWQQSGETTRATFTETADGAERTVFCPLSAICAVAYEWDDSPKG